MNPPTHESIVGNYWLIYFQLFRYQSIVASSGKKKSTQPTKRRSVLKSIRDLVGYFPTEKEVRAILSHGEEIDESLVPLILRDIKQLSS